jgi:serine/threonine-protein kinase HipA
MKPLRLLEVYYQDQPMGRLAPYRDGTVWEYDDSFSLELSPVRLPLASPRAFKNDPRFSRLPGALADALPDSWGMQIMEKYFAQRGWPQPGPLERLAYVAQHGLGALSFRPGLQENTTAEEISLIRLEGAAREFTAASPSSALAEIMRHTSSVGGARPKALISVDPKTGRIWTGRGLQSGLDHWIIKFQSGAEDEDPLVERAFSLLATRCGLRVPETCLFEVETPQGRARHFGSRRFDLQADRRIHFHSFAGLYEGDYEGASQPDYWILIATTGALTGHHQEKVEMFRRALFNVLIDNGDDHARNHGFLFDGRAWRCSPAYDLTHTKPSPTTERAMPVMGAARLVTQNDFWRLATRTDIPLSEARAAMEQIEEALVHWPEIAAAVGLSETFTNEISQTIHQRKADLQKT